MARPRSERAHEAVIAAALKLIADKGIDITSVDAIAELSGVSKATIYKHWRTKEALCLEAIGQVSGSFPAFASGDPRSDLIELVGYIGRAKHLKKGGLGKIWPRIMAHAIGNFAFARALRAQFEAPRRAQLTSILQQAEAQGKLRSGIDLDLAMDLLFGPVMHRHFARTPMPSDMPEKVVDAFWSTNTVGPVANRRRLVKPPA
jgi:AcrR family transcriptional regulator